MIKKNSYKVLFITSILLIASILLSGCFALESSSSDNSVEEEGFDSMPRAETLSTDNNRMEIPEQKLITRSNLQIESEALAESTEQMEELIANYSASITDSRQQSSNNRRFFSYTIKVPADYFSELMSDLESLGEVKEKQISSQDVTENYIDLQTRKQNLAAQEDKYRQLLDQAERVKEVLEVERELNRVRTEIERLENQLNYYDSRIELSTIQLRLFEPETLLSQYRLPDSLQQAVKGFISSIHQIIIFTGYLLPWLIVLVVIAIAIYKLIKNLRA